MHNTTKASEVGINSNNSPIPRPHQKQLGKYFRQGYETFKDEENRQYLLVHKVTHEVLRYNPASKKFDNINIEELGHKD